MAAGRGHAVVTNSGDEQGDAGGKGGGPVKARLHERLFGGCSFCHGEAFHNAVDCKMAQEGDRFQQRGIGVAWRMEG